MVIVCAAKLSGFIFMLTASFTCDRAQLPWSNPPMCRTRILVAHAILLVGRIIFGADPTILLVHDAADLFVANRRSMLCATAAGGRTGRPVAKLPMIFRLFCAVRR